MKEPLEYSQNFLQCDDIFGRGCVESRNPGIFFRLSRKTICDLGIAQGELIVNIQRKYFENYF